MFSMFPSSDEPYQQTFFCIHANGTTAKWQVWDKPKGARLVWAVLIGAGGCGGNGFTGAAAAARGGGGGGGTGPVSKLWAPAILLPDRLYLSVGKGGSTAGTFGGDITQMSLTPGTSQAGMQVNGGNGGTAGAGSGAAVAGTAGTVTTFSTFSGLPWSFVNASGGSGGSGGNATGTPGTAVVMGASLAGLSGGAGGGGVTAADTAGGTQSTPDATWIPAVIGGAAGSNRGADGQWSWGPLYVGGRGGCGGGSSNAGVGGAGGVGAYGCGGGGGGGGTTGGAGGNGGDGLIIIGVI